jgi:hypothetical protein
VRRGQIGLEVVHVEAVVAQVAVGGLAAFLHEAVELHPHVGGGHRGGPEEGVVVMGHNLLGDGRRGIRGCP